MYMYNRELFLVNEHLVALEANLMGTYRLDAWVPGKDINEEPTYTLRGLRPGVLAPDPVMEAVRVAADFIAHKYGLPEAPWYEWDEITRKETQ